MGEDQSILHRLRGLLDRRQEVLEAYLFGSRARGSARADSDVDVAVYLAPHARSSGPFGYDAELATDIMKGLGLNAVDVVILNHAPPLLYHRVLRDGVRLISRDPRATAVREGRALSRYCDYVPQLAKIEAGRRAGRRASQSEA